MNFIEFFSLVLHRSVAEKMCLDERRVIEFGHENLERWLSSGTFSGDDQLALLEWKQLLETRTPADIRKIMTADTPEGRRLRQSSPFAGVLTEEERQQNWDECAQFKPV